MLRICDLGRRQSAIIRSDREKPPVGPFQDVTAALDLGLNEPPVQDLMASCHEQARHVVRRTIDGHRAMLTGVSARVPPCGKGMCQGLINTYLGASLYERRKNPRKSNLIAHCIQTFIQPASREPPPSPATDDHYEKHPLLFGSVFSTLRQSAAFSPPWPSIWTIATMIWACSQSSRTRSCCPLVPETRGLWFPPASLAGRHNGRPWSRA